uniref:BTB domain-containing protein n=1 Tax=Pygocentrus nattereri TaxID=42514 RepID=A0AAR2KJH8_PYGNA
TLHTLNSDRKLKTTSEQGQEMDISEKSSEDEEFDDDDDDDDDDDNDDDDDTNDEYEEYEEYPEKLYCQPAYSKKVFQALEEMKQSSFLTDLLLITDSGHSFQAHSMVLATVSTVIQKMLQERNEEMVFLRLAPEVSGLGLSAVLEFAYTGTIAGLNRESLAQIQTFQPALSLCLSFMQQEMDAHSCLDVAAFAEAYGMSELQDMADDFVLRHFEEVAATLKFQDLPAEKLKTYLHSNCLCVASELPVLKAVISWIGANPRRRVKEARELLATIHFPLMTFKEFKEVKAVTTWPKVSTEDLYDSLLEEFCSSNFNVHTDFRTYLPKEALVLAGGERITEDFDKRTPCTEIWFSNSFRNHVGLMKRVEWRLLGDLPEKPRFSHSVGVIRGNLYVSNQQFNTICMKYNPMQNSWQKLADMQERRGSFALVVLDERIYAIGGDKDSEANVESVEVYCPSTDSWSYVHPLDQPLSGHAASVWNGKIFISGGFDCRYQCLVSMLLYHPDKGTTYLADMSQNRAQHCMETFQDCLYVAGGVSDAGGQVVDQLACEFYDPVSDFWAAIMPMSVPHVSAASAVLEGKIYIIGGYCQEDYSDMKRVHRYDPATQCWENMCGTPGPTTYIAACVLPIPPHLRHENTPILVHS